MCQVSSGEFCLVDPCVNLFVDFVECGLEGCIGGAEVGKRGGQSRTQQSVVGAGKEQRCAQAELGDAIAEAVRQALDQAVQAQAAQLVGDGALGDRFRIAAGQGGELLAQIVRAKALCKLAEQDDCMQQRVDARIGKAQARGTLAAGRDRAVDALKGIFRQDAIMADMLDIEQAVVGRKTDFAQLRQIAQTPADAEIVAVVDGGLGAQGAVFLVVLLDPGVFVIDVQGRCYVLGQDAGPKPSRCLAVILRLKISWTSCGRPRSRFSRITCSKNRRPCTGRSSTWVNENSACRIEIS